MQRWFTWIKSLLNTSKSCGVRLKKFILLSREMNCNSYVCSSWDTCISAPQIHSLKINHILYQNCRSLTLITGVFPSSIEGNYAVKACVMSRRCSSNPFSYFASWHFHPRADLCNFMYKYSDIFTYFWKQVKSLSIKQFIKKDSICTLQMI